MDCRFLIYVTALLIAYSILSCTGHKEQPMALGCAHQKTKVTRVAHNVPEHHQCWRVWATLNCGWRCRLSVHHCNALNLLHSLNQILMLLLRTWKKIQISSCFWCEMLLFFCVRLSFNKNWLKKKKKLWKNFVFSDLTAHGFPFKW